MFKLNQSEVDGWPPAAETAKSDFSLHVARAKSKQANTQIWFIYTEFLAPIFDLILNLIRVFL